MSTLDSPNQNIDQSSVSAWPTASRYGLIASLILIVVGLGMHLSGMVDYTGQNSGSAWISNIINWVIMGGAFFMAVRHHRDEELGGSITFGRGFQVGFLASLVIAVITAIWTFVFFSFIAPDVLSTIVDASKEQMIEQQGMSAGDAEEAMGMVGWMFTAPMMTVFASIGTIITGVIISLIVAAIMKKD
ncbi:MAG: DUF4199 domain-containing protein [Saprospiraceae bacterium]|nr:DUF4199 domain-containing protein [Saprospiraceae bacterium]